MQLLIHAGIKVKEKYIVSELMGVETSIGLFTSNMGVAYTESCDIVRR